MKARSIVHRTGQPRLNTRCRSAFRSNGKAATTFINRRHPRSSLTAACLWPILASLLAACQPQSNTVRNVSLDEAKRLSAQFQNAPFTSPPRTVTDVLVALGPEREAPPSCQTSTPAWQIEKRELTHSGVNATLAFQYSLSAQFEFFQGRYRNSVRFAEEASRVAPTNGFWRDDSYMYFALARYQALTGDLDAARASWRRGHSAANFTGGTTIDHLLAKDRVDAHSLTVQGTIAQLEGRNRDAERLYRQVLAEHVAGLAAYMSPDIVRSELATVLARQARFAEAEALLREVLSGGYSYSLQTAYYLSILSRIIYEQGRFSDAESIIRRVLNMLRVTCAPPGSINVAAAQQLLAEILVATERWPEALSEFQSIRDTVVPVDAETFGNRFGHNVDWGLALINTKQHREAIAFLSSAAESLARQFGDRSYRAAEARAMLGVAYARSDEIGMARQEIEKALPILIEVFHASELGGEGPTTADRRLVFVLEAYIGLLVDERVSASGMNKGQELISRAFMMAELARGRTVQRALSASGARAVRDPKLADMVRRSQDAEHQLSALANILTHQLSSPRMDRDTAVVSKLRDQVESLRVVTRELQRGIRDSFPEYSALVNPMPATITAVQQLLRAGEALIATYTTAERTYVWAVPKAGEAAFASLQLGRDELGRTVSRLRRSLDPNAVTMGDIPAFDVAMAHELYRALLDPVGAGWKDARELLVVAHGPLGALPLSVLPTRAIELPPEGGQLFVRYRSVPWLAREHSVSMLPTGTSLGALRSSAQRVRAPQPFVGFGDPCFDAGQCRSDPEPGQLNAVLTTRGAPAPTTALLRRSAPQTRTAERAGLSSLPALPETASELESIARALKVDPQTNVFLGRAFNEADLKSMNLSDRRVVAFATHGLAAGDLDGLTEPALALSSATVMREGEDGLLTMGEILGLRLNADWVILSACNTAAAYGAGAEAVSGLGRAFLYAGARSLLVSNWPVETISAKTLTTEIFKVQSLNPLSDRSDALRQAMLRLIDEGGYMDESNKLIVSYAHPIFWAPFTLIGDGSGRSGD